MKKIILVSLIASSVLFGAYHVIDQKGKTFLPNTIKAKVGDVIVFKNSDPYAHNAYTDDEENEFDISMQPPGKKEEVKITSKGNFSVECAIHPNMLLEVEVE